MQRIAANKDKQSGFLRSFLALLLFLSAMMPAFAFDPYNPWPRQPFTGAYPGYAPGYNYSYPPWQGYYPGRPPFMSPWPRTFTSQQPWGTVNGGMAPDGSFWVNIRFGGSFRDLQTLMGIMQMSGAMQMNLNNHQQSVPDMNYYSDEALQM